MPPTDARDGETDPYELLGVQLEASEQEIRTAYRQRSLKVHPDRNRNNPDAARKFHELNQAYELLLDPLRRLALDAKHRIEQARKARFANFDAKRKNLVVELEERERAVKKAKVEEEKAKVERWKDEERIKDEGRRRREERAEEIRRREEEAERENTAREEEHVPPPLGDLDTTVRLKYSLATHTTLTTNSALSALLAAFGPSDTESIVISNPPASKPGKKPKKTTALVPFRQIGHAFAAVCASGRPGFEGIEIGWVGGGEPAILGWLRARGELRGYGEKTRSASPPHVGEKAPLPQSKTRTANSATFSSFPDSFPDMPNPIPEPLKVAPVSGVDYESLTLMRMRQAERERLEREIREAEETGGS